MWRLPPSWFRNDWSEVAEVMAVGRWFQSLTVRGKKELNRTGWCGEKRVKQDRMVRGKKELNRTGWCGERRG